MKERAKKGKKSQEKAYMHPAAYLQQQHDN